VPCFESRDWCLLQVSVDGQTITTGKGYPDTRSVRIQREDILYGYAAEPSTPLRVLLLSAPLTGCIIEAAPKIQADNSGQALLVLAQTLVTGPARARCITKTAELKHSYVMVKSFEHLIRQKIDAIVAECATMLPTCGGCSSITPEVQHACLRCFTESLVYEHIMQSLARMWADEVGRFAANCDSISASDSSLPRPPSTSSVLQHILDLQKSCCYTQKAEIFQSILDAILRSAGGEGGVISTDDLLPFIISFICVHARDGSLLLHVLFCDCLQHTLLGHGEWGFTLSLFKSAVIYVASYISGSSSSVGGAATGFPKGSTARKNSIVTAALGSSCCRSTLEEPLTFTSNQQLSQVQAALSSPIVASKTGSGNSSFTRPSAMIIADAPYKNSTMGCRGVDWQGEVADRHMLGSFLNSLLDDD
jgi:hypothetical protein